MTTEPIGAIPANLPMVALLYLLHQHYLSSAELENLVERVAVDLQGVSPLALFTNGYLAAYATELANRLEGKGDQP